MTLASQGRFGIAAYDLVDQLPAGPARAAAWNAYVCQIYGDKLAAACSRPTYQTASVIRVLYRSAVAWLEQAAAPSPAPAAQLELPTWNTPYRSHEELVGIRDAVEALRAYVAYQLPPDLQSHLAEIDIHVNAAASLWIERAPDELRGGIGRELNAALSETIALGRRITAG